ncbi:MAG: alpha-galactosidase [Opitutales bacterium]
MKTNNHIISRIILAAALLTAASSNLCVAGLPGVPANAPAELQADEHGFSLHYSGAQILSASSSENLTVDADPPSTDSDGAIEQRIVVSGQGNAPGALKLTINASSQAIAAESSTSAQQAFPIVRTSHGPSLNLRNNAVYDRFGDWLIEMPDQHTRITPVPQLDGSIRFDVEISSDSAEIIFRPRFYQKHKNIRHFEPWKYQVRRDSITGWCSWWAHHNKFRQEHLDDLLDVWQRKRFADYGYNIIQIDDVFQGEADAGRQNHPLNYGYVGGRPATWLEWKKDRFPAGMTGYVDAVRRAGFDAGVWIGCFFSDEETAEEHPEWFVRDADGQPYAGPYVSYAIDATNPEAANRLVRPTYRGLDNAGFRYVKIDQLRHMLYDNLHHNIEYASRRGLEPADIFRAYLGTAREELGRDTFILSCWGVLPESVGIADACRIGGDGYGPVTMQQYNSWNGIVWRNDPDHCDVRPKRKAAELGNVRKTTAIEAIDRDTIIRPALASIAGCVLMLSDKAEVYEDDRNLHGLRRSSPVLFSVPGQLDDFDSSKTDALKNTPRTAVKSGEKMSPIDGDQHGEVCPWWLNEFNLPFAQWNVLHRLNWSSDAAAAERVRFEDIGLHPEKEYLVYEFWTDRFLGAFQGDFEVPELSAMGLRSYAIREKQSRPQLLSTNRHLSQGAAELESCAWEDDGHSLVGRSRVVAEDRYVLSLHLPQAYSIRSATFDGKDAEITREGSIARIAFLPPATDSVGWSIQFEH